MRSTPKVTTAVTKKITIFDFVDEKISSMVALLKILKLVPINTPAMAAVGIWEKTGAKNKVIINKTNA